MIGNFQSIPNTLLGCRVNSEVKDITITIVIFSGEMTGNDGREKGDSYVTKVQGQIQTGDVVIHGRHLNLRATRTRHDPFTW